MRNKRSYDYDIAIVGGGLAGLTLAMQSADAGYRVILFEKENYPFHKVCGEYISMESWNFLIRCGLPLHDWSLPIINHLQVSDTKGKCFDFDLPLGGFGISRYKMDFELKKIAESAGVIVYENCKVEDVFFGNEKFELHTAKGIFTSTICTGSFGKRRYT